MKTMAATEARKRFGELLDIVKTEPLCIQRRGRDVAVVLSPEEFARLWKASSDRVSPIVRELHRESVERWAQTYKALAK